jgi:uncharacterized repeat protein (TIGR04076 family)
MPYKVKATLVGFLGNQEKFPCHFDYKIGDSFTYDGEIFEGRVCSGLMHTVIPDMMIMAHSGQEHFKRIMFRYHGGRSVRDPGFKKYDGVGFRMAKDKPDPEKAIFTPRPEGGRISFCGDPLTLAGFRIEPVDLAPGGYFRGEYMREMSILEKIKAEPGLTVDDILSKYNDFERYDVYPQLNPGIVKLMLEEMETVNYIEMKEGKAYPQKGKKT